MKKVLFTLAAILGLSLALVAALTLVAKALAVLEAVALSVLKAVVLAAEARAQAYLKVLWLFRGLHSTEQ